MAGNRQNQPIPLEYAPGLYSNATDLGAIGRWIDGDNVRWTEGLPEKLGGYELSELVDPDGVLTTYIGKVRSTWEWDSLDGETWIAIGTACKLYLINRNVLYDITPMRRQISLTDTVTVTGTFNPSLDPHFANVSLWLECDGADLSTAFPDASSYAHTMTTTGTTHVTTTAPKFGAGSLINVAGGNFVSTPMVAELDLHAGDFTAELWFKNNSPGIGILLSCRDVANSSGLTLTVNRSTGDISAVFFGGASQNVNIPTMTTGVWYHMALVVSGNTQLFFFNGVLVATTGISVPGLRPAFTNPFWYVGADVFGFAWEGNLDEVVIYKGYAKYTTGFTPSGPPLATGGTATIVDIGHGAQAGDHLRIFNATTVGGVNINGQHEILSVIDENTLTIDLSTSPLTAASGGGTFTIQYDISCGLESDGPLYGYGVGTYGTGTYGTARTSSTFMGRARHWSLDNWGEDLMASPNGETLYYWKRSTGPDSRAVAVVGAPENIERMMVGPDDRHVIVFGSNLVSTGQHDKMFVRWCAGDDFNTWISAAINDAGSKRLDAGSRLITAVKTNNGILIFSDKALYFVSLVGGTDVYSIAPRGFTVEIVSPEAAIDIDGVVYFMAHGDFYMWNGTLQVLDCDIHTKVFGTQKNPKINKLSASKVQVRRVSEFNEIWWSYPSFHATENDSTAIYNYHEKCWYFSSIPREAGRMSSPSLDRQPYAFYNHRFWIQELGTDGDDGDGYVEPLHATLTSSYREVLEGAAEVRISKLIPDFDELEAMVDVTLIGKERPQATVTKVRGPTIVWSDTERICPDIRTRQVALVIDSNDLGAAWRMGTWKANATLVTRKS